MSWNIVTFVDDLLFPNLSLPSVILQCMHNATLWIAIFVFGLYDFVVISVLHHALNLYINIYTILTIYIIFSQQVIYLFILVYMQCSMFASP